MLIIGYKRPQLLSAQLSIINTWNTKVYLFIDRDSEVESDENTELIRIAEELERLNKLTLIVSAHNLGVALAVPTAVDWVLSQEQSVIVLEDDCIPSLEFMSFVERYSNYVVKNVVLISGSNWDQQGHNSRQELPITLSSYPLIWGWYTNKRAWQKLNTLRNQRVKSREIAKIAISRPGKLVPTLYFLALEIRTLKGFTKQWDGTIALRMLVSNLCGITPNVLLIQNIGNDSVASHPMEFVKNASTETNILAPNHDFSNKMKNRADKLIERNVYKIRGKHLFSPLKAMLLK